VVEATTSSSEHTNAFQVKKANETLDLFKVTRAGNAYVNGSIYESGT
jgi:hypothetical protein